MDIRPALVEVATKHDCQTIVLYDCCILEIGLVVKQRSRSYVLIVNLEQSWIQEKDQQERTLFNCNKILAVKNHFKFGEHEDLTRNQSSKITSSFQLYWQSLQSTELSSFLIGHKKFFSTVYLEQS